MTRANISNPKRKDVAARKIGRWPRPPLLRNAIPKLDQLRLQASITISAFTLSTDWVTLQISAAINSLVVARLIDGRALFAIPR